MSDSQNFVLAESKQQMRIPRNCARFVAHCTVQACSTLILYVPCIMSNSICLTNFSCTKFPTYMFQHSRGCRMHEGNCESTVTAFSAWKIGVFHKSDCYRSHLEVFIFRGKFFFSWLNIPNRPRLPNYWGSESTLRHTTLGRNPVDEWSARRRDLILTTHNTHNRQTSMPSAVLQPATWENERPQTHA